MAVSFDSVALSVIKEAEITVDAPFKQTTLLSGKVYVQASPEQMFARTFECYTEDFTEISDLLGKLGSSATLVIDSESFTTCFIAPPIRYKELIKGSGKYAYNINFVRHTA
ncbi:MAG: hypothetical protein Q8J68_08985 [Methanolobus sp.]|uniref:hypothetical protein n=1 Tax=Methanolobus sp. TaxID=1874737 RepID=UPI002730FACB|nr:hypothetical protein [Methanolobus sp.]MDP2217407.1 hypothetical protein [Methanolobus sp.]